LPYTINYRKLNKFAILIFICILVLHGTYFRIRSTTMVPTIDWLVIARLLACAIGFIIGIILISKKLPLGFAAKVLLIYVLATGISAINSPYPVIVFGYFILLLGASSLMIGLVYSAKNTKQLEKIERIWFLTVSVLLIKDSLISLLFPKMQPEAEIFRIGMGVTHANQLSILAGIVFWISFKQEKASNSRIIWLFRSFLIFLIIDAISRVSITAFLVGGAFYFSFKGRNYLSRLVIVVCCIVVLSTFIMLSHSFGFGWTNNIIDYLRRGQDKNVLSTFTGRTDIWQLVINESLESPIFGHGYGVSRLTMGPLPYDSYQPAHCHNEVLEVFFTTGLLGLIPFLIMFVYSLNWLKRFSWLSRTFSKNFALHAICVVIMLLVSSGFEARIGVRLLPTQPIFFLYLLALDLEKDFSRSVSTLDINGE